MILDKELNFNEHLDNKISKANKGIGMIRKLHHIVPRKTLLNIYKSYIRPHLKKGKKVKIFYLPVKAAGDTSLAKLNITPKMVK